MSAHQPSAIDPVDASGTDRRPHVLLGIPAWALWTVALTLGIGAGAGLTLLHRTQAPSLDSLTPAVTKPVATWAYGARRAPEFRLTDQYGKPVLLQGLRGRPVVVTFIDPLCRNLCPLEARVLSDAVRRLPASIRPTIVAVSVNPWGDSRASFRQDGEKWHLGPEWRWGAGSHERLAGVWRSYGIGVQVTKKTLAGVTVREISHTEAAYLVDPAGYQRALFLYPFEAAGVARTLRQLADRS